MKKIERDLITLYAIMKVLDDEKEYHVSQYINDYDADVVTKWVDKHIQGDPNKIIELFVELANKVYTDIKNKK